MKKFIAMAVGLLFVVLVAGPVLSAESKKKESAPLYQFKTLDIDKQPVKLSKYKGKVLLIVNVASHCGHTPQYAGLEKLYEKYKGKGFVILGFPCNQFMGQEPGTEKDIKDFCTTKYNVQFPLFAKIEVNGPNTDPIYQYLKKELPDSSGKGDIGWNFTKFLIDRKGNPVKRFSTSVEPEKLDEDIQKTVGE